MFCMMMINWFRMQLGYKGDNIRSDSANKRVTVMIQGAHDS